jgi:hypothetical protein
MDHLDRPNLGLDVVEQIEVDLHQQDMRFWPLLKQLQFPTPETQKAYAPFVFNEGPMPPRRPQKLSELLGSYAVASFQCEASKYPRLDPQFGQWLQQLARRIEERTIQRVEQLEAGNPANSLAYHGLSIESMRAAVNKSLHDAVKAWPQSGELPSTREQGAQPKPRHLSPPSSSKRLTTTVHSVAAAERMEAFIRANGRGITEFAISAGTTDKTLRSFRRTGRVRRDIFEGIAKAMGITKVDLLGQ